MKNAADIARDMLPKCPHNLEIHAYLGQSPLEQPILSQNARCLKCGAQMALTSLSQGMENHTGLGLVDLVRCLIQVSQSRSRVKL